MPRQSRLLCCYSSSFVAFSNWCVASADGASLMVGVELSDLVVALHAIQRCLSKAAFDCTPKMAHFASEWKAWSSSRGNKKKKDGETESESRRGLREGEVDGTVCNLLFWLYFVSDWFSVNGAPLICSPVKSWVRELILLPSALSFSLFFLPFFPLSVLRLAAL